MKNFKHIIVGSVLFLSLLFNSHNIYAQETKERLANRFEIISTNFSEALASSNYGVAESALYHSVLFQHRMIGAKDERLQKAVNRLFQTSNNDRIRHKAYLVNTLLSQPDGLFTLSPDQLRSEETFYKAVGDLLTHRFIQTKHTE